MGCQTSQQFRINPMVAGQGPEIRTLMKKLDLTEQDIDKFWSAFYAIDKEHLGVITVHDFHTFYGIEETAFSTRAFSIMDIDKSGNLNFEEYVIAIWNFLTCDVGSLAIFSFMLFDLDGSKYLEAAEIDSMIECVYGRKIDHNEKVGKVLHKLDEDSDGRVSLTEFVQFSKRYPLVLYPAFVIQERLRSHVFGSRYWENASRKRSEVQLDLTVFDILRQLSHETVSSAKLITDVDVSSKNTPESKYSIS